MTIASLVPSVQHLIKIGDPLQLRPHIQSQALKGENSPDYRLDESLFERLMKKVPYSRLVVQRRAHTDMADLLRAGDYPFLVDHPKTASHPEIRGFKHRMFWVNHNLMEDQPDPGSALAKSFSNKYEVRFICEAVKYLVQHKDYSMTRITILTPYNGQVALFVKNLRSFCKVLLNDDDKKSMVEMGMISEKEIESKQEGGNQVSLDSLIRVTTVDNYQGEENDIVFLSTVRSNATNKAGFLGNQNRINVAISRARNGFYIVGNAELLEAKVDGWRKVIRVFKQKNLIGSELPLLPCDKHGLTTDIVVDIKHPENFRKIPDCEQACGATLSCNHVCQHECHAEEMHTDGRLPCSEKCSKTLECGHNCKNLCKDECGPCQEPLQDMLLDCGHKMKVACSQDVSEVKCTTIIGAYKSSKCGHIRFRLCSEGLVPCKEPCDRLQPCGHVCQSLCHECEHEECKQVCGKPLDCGHKCQSRCHFGSTDGCPPCEQPCKTSCPHGSCHFNCSEICNPCVKEGMVTHCEHHDPALICSLQSSRTPCSEQCKLSAPCGIHQCEGLCGEACPEKCNVCEAAPQQGRLFTLPCGCTFELDELDKKFQLSKLYRMDGHKVLEASVTGLPDKSLLKCPSCSSSIVGTVRYALCLQIHELNDLFGSLLAPLGRRLWAIMKFINHKQHGISYHMTRTCQQMQGGPLMVKHNQDVIANQLESVRDAMCEVERIRDTEIRLVQDSIVAYTAYLGEPSGTMNDIGTRKSDSSPLLGIPQLPYLLRSERVIIRCKLLIASFLWDVYQSIKRQGHLDDHLALFSDVLKAEAQAEASGVIKQLDDLILQCQASNLRRLEVEFIIQQVSFVSLVRLFGDETEDMTPKLRRALNICTQHNSAKVLYSRVLQVTKLIKEGSYSTGLDDAFDVKSEAQLLWRHLAKFERGALTKCASGHYYSSKHFKSCPECE